MSEAVYKNLANRKEISSEFIREEYLKNVAEPVKVYEINVKEISGCLPDDVNSYRGEHNTSPENQLTQQGDKSIRVNLPSTDKYRMLKIVAALTAIVALAYLLFELYSSKEVLNNSQIVYSHISTEKEISSAVGQWPNFVISAQGDAVAYYQQGKGLYVQRLNDFTPIFVTGTKEGAGYNPVFSPDGTHVAFTAIQP